VARTVVRLKGGDPFVFGRGGEEAEYLSERGIPFEIVPGVTSAVAVPAYAGIPVTHRGVAASLAVVTGRAGPIGEAPTIDWDRIAGADTIVVLMGVANQEPLVRALVDRGRSPDTPVAAIRWGTTAQQRVVVGTLVNPPDGGGGFYPIVLRLDGRRTLIVGGGKVAARKAGGLLAAGARVVAVSPMFCPTFTRLIPSGAVTCVQRAYQPSDLADMNLVIAANRRSQGECRGAGRCTTCRAVGEHRRRSRDVGLCRPSRGAPRRFSACHFKRRCQSRTRRSLAARTRPARP
jgi:hypothetical protein